MRLFIAITPDEKTKLALKMLSRHFTIKTPLHWTPIENYHLTLRFLGECEPVVYESIRASLSEIVSEIGAFSLAPKKPMALPLHCPKFIAMAYSLPMPLANLVSHIEKQVNRHGFITEKKPYIPHVTLARIPKQTPDFELASFATQHACHISATSVDIYETLAMKDGSRYKLLCSLPLRENSSSHVTDF